MKVKKNLDGIRTSSNILKSLNLKANESISKFKVEKPSLKEYFLKYHGENLAKCFTWDEPKGKELL